jgi:hypothetical protein
MSQDALREAADRIEIHELLNGYALAIDTWDWDLLGRVFTEDAVADFTSVGRYVKDESTLRGLDDIVTWYEAALEPFRGVMHFMTNHRVEIDGDTARASCYMHVMNMGMGGIYETDCVRTGAGWRIRHLRLEEVRFDEVAEKLERHMASVDAAGADADE